MSFYFARTERRVCAGQHYIRGMPETWRLTAIIGREDEGFVALCPEVDIASDGASIEEARANLVEALMLFFETASASEVSRRSKNEVYVTQVDVAAE